MGDSRGVTGGESAENELRISSRVGDKTVGLLYR